MHVQLVDPAAYTPPYDHALAAALARAGARGDLVTTRSEEWTGAIAGTDAQGGLPYARHTDFYRHSAGLPSPWRQVARAAEHPVGLRRLRARGADVTHVQWAPLTEVDALGLPRRRPLAITAHDILTREPRPLQHAAAKAIYGRAQLVVVHSEHGRERLIDEAGVDPSRIRVIPHGAFDHLAAVPRAPLPAELTAEPGGEPTARGAGSPPSDRLGDPSGEMPVDARNRGRLQTGSPSGVERNRGRLQSATGDIQRVRSRRPVVLSFGLIRPYKGTDLLLRAWQNVRADAELWIVGKPRGVDLAELRALADERVKFVPRFVTDGELAACFDAAQLAVLPYREIEQSGVLATALAFGTPVLASAVGAFPEAAALGAAATVPPNDERALATAIDRLIADPTERALLTVGARALSRGAWSWDAVAQQHLAAYEELLA